MDIFDGIKKFNKTDFLHNKELFEKLGRAQNPHTLFIGCSDSRVVPTLITKTLPGELFIIRNIANIVPYYRLADEFLATTSAIEYAFKILKIQNIVICGHSNCGGCTALHESDEVLAETPHTKKWLELSSRVKEKIDSENIDDPIEKEWKTEQLNVVEQMNHLITYPYIKQAYRENKLAIYGWYYLIETGEVYNYDKDKKEFILVE